ncbi:PAAR domain-containing protein [Jannaschia sp. Os4]|uniref:PAAR domain-containing protein n=1 Tax=Jannaschia sp. Os4 TaxID=2807617 RepID=UPI00193A674F|nr:PAAR domain-containing protein [Jannaschia sp. Os4]MBM2578087.1 PAAR domain-containing protein [Jannaschia sp. Os4]
MLPVARLGDKHVCPAHGPNPIVEGGSGLVDGRPVARVGDKTACGAVITTGSSMATCDGKAVAYVGSVTNHGGTIVEGSPQAKTLP